MRLTISHLPFTDLLSVFSVAFTQIFQNYVYFLLPALLLFLPFLLSLLTVKKSEKRFLEFYALGLLALSCVFPSQTDPSPTNLVMNEPLIVRGISFPFLM